MRLEEFLESRRVPFEHLMHRPAYTANRTAQALHVPGRDMAKSVLLRGNHGYCLAVLPATHQVDMELLRREIGEEWLELASEPEVATTFHDCETGAMPPFGSLYRLPTVVDQSLAEEERIVFEGQTHHDAYRMAFRDFMEAEHPKMGRFGKRDGEM